MNPEVAAAETKALIAELWQRHLPTLRERLGILDRIAVDAVVRPLPTKDREEAIAISHKFAGSLGMYGYTRGTEVASQLEQLLRSQTSPEPELMIALTYELREAIFPANR